MVHIFSRLKPKEREWIHLDQEFPSRSKTVPGYANALNGLEIRGENVSQVLEEFSTTKNSVMFLHIPKETYEEFREYQIQAVKKDTIRALNISTDFACEDFLQSYSPVRFSFRLKHYLFFFETDALGKLKKDSTIYLLEKPQVIYQERRSHQRYKLWPEYRVLLNDMPVADISQKGLSFFSAQDFGKQNTIDNAVLVFPAVHSSSEGESYGEFEGGQITIPQTVIANCMREKKGYRYGVYFTMEWPAEDIKTLNNFLLAMRKKQRKEQEGSA